jgi:predicted oxidoreductase
MTVTYRADVVIAGGGLAGLATANELLDRGQRVLILERDSEDRLGGLAKRSFGGVMFSSANSASMTTPSSRGRTG